MKLVSCLTAKNEEWIIEKILTCLDTFCDKIVILDDNSSDQTENICKSFDKVDWYVRKKREIWDRKEAEGLNELFNLASSYNPEYILMLDADEIPSHNFIDFFHNIDQYNNINAWKFSNIQLWSDEKHYRVDNFQTSTGVGINYDPLTNNHTKTILLKYNPEFNYKYDLTKQKGGTSKNHPLPKNIPRISSLNVGIILFS